MKQALISFGLAVLVVVSLAATRGTVEQPKYKYLVVRVPATAVDVEFDGGGKASKLKSFGAPPLDSLGREGWELVSATVDGTTFVCFLKAPLDAK